MSLSGQFRNDLGNDGDSQKQIGSEYVLEVQYLSDGSNITAWQKNSNDVREWTPRFKRYYHKEDHENQYDACKAAYGRITSVSSMKEELHPYGEMYSNDYDPEIPKED